MSRDIVCIYARAANGAIGQGGKLPWHLPADLRRFKQLTMDTPMIMGRKTFESLPGTLPGRRHIVLTRRDCWDYEGAELVHSPEEALALVPDENVSVIGGAAIYDVFLPLATRVEMTQIHANYQGDTFMPPLAEEWAVVAREDHPEAEGRPAYSFVTLRRRETESAAGNNA